VHLSVVQLYYLEQIFNGIHSFLRDWGIQQFSEAVVGLIFAAF
jgi:hypothetical protein